MKFNLWFLLVPVLGLMAQKIDYNIQLKNAPFKTVVAYGDGVHGDSSLIQAALTAACAQTNDREVFLPAPSVRYIIDTSISMPCDNIYFHASGSYAKMFIQDGVAVGITTNKKNHIKIENLQLFGTGNIANQVCLYVDSTGTSTSGNSINNNIMGTCGTKPPLTVTGAVIKIRGDNLELTIARNIFSVWGTGLDFDSTNDLLKVEDNVFGTDATGNDSGFGVTMVNSAGAGRQLFDHNNFITPGGMVNFGSINGGIIFTNNQYENLAGSPNFSGAASTVAIFGSAIKYEVHGNNIGVHGHANYCFNVNSFSGGTFNDNACYNSVVAQWNNTAMGYGLTFDNNNDGTSNGSQVVYTNPNAPGIRQHSLATNLISWGTTFPRSGYHFNFTDAPYNADTTLAADITDTTGTSVTVTSATNISVGSLIYIGLEQFTVYVKVGNVLTVSRGENGSTAALHSSGALVAFGPGGGVLFTSTRFVTNSLSFGAESAFMYLKARQLNGSVYLPIPIRLDLLNIESTNSTIDTLLSIKGRSGQSGDLLSILDSSASKKIGLSATGGILSMANNANIQLSQTTTGGIILSYGAIDGTGTLSGTFSNNPFDMYSNSLKHASLPVDGGVRIFTVTPPTCDITHEGTVFYFHGTPSTLKVCAFSSTSTYVYVTIVTAP